MLARNAESLYWIGRYVERADDTARILDVAVHQLLEDTTVNPDARCRLVLQVLGMELPPKRELLDAWSLTERVAYAKTLPGSIVDSVGQARENARGAREVTSSEMWECLNTTYNGLGDAERASRKLGPYEFLSYVKNRAAMFAGLADATLSHDDGYRYLLLGRSVERVDMTVRMLLSRAGDRSGSPAWVTVLRSAGAHDTYLRTYRGALDATRVVEFMLLDRLFPRSVFHAINLAEQQLLHLDNRPSRVGARAEAERLLGRARSGLEFMRPGVLLEDLQPRLVDLQETCREVSEAVTAQYFHVSPYVAWAGVSASDSVNRFIEESEL
ncbi:alpha-E domain-containing protein [Williamsia sp.]|uniref:alpha-E domain-containing protein n=1 Tax=Williamsia sp. TaxID=1872085 RepID=UPI002F93274F